MLPPYYFSENALYYTFSTIAQTLAAGFGVLTAFVLFRLPQIEQAITRAQLIFDRHKKSIGSDEIWRTLRRRGIEALAEKFRKLEQEKHITNDDLETLYEQLEEMGFWLPTWDKLHRNLIITVLCTAFDIAICLVALPCVPFLSINSAPSIIVIYVTVILAVICLALYCILILALVDPRRIIRNVNF
jgi:hypothetical protein